MGAIKLKGSKLKANNFTAEIAERGDIESETGRS